MSLTDGFLQVTSRVYTEHGECEPGWAVFAEALNWLYFTFTNATPDHSSQNMSVLG